jgi:hypothetical protein
MFATMVSWRLTNPELYQAAAPLMPKADAVIRRWFP